MPRKSYWKSTWGNKGHQVVIINHDKDNIATEMEWDDKMRLFRINIRPKKRESK